MTKPTALDPILTPERVADLLRTLTPSGTRPYVRTLVPSDGDVQDPYILLHADPAALSDARLAALWKEWIAQHPFDAQSEHDTVEHFEDWLHWLETDQGYVELISANNTWTLSGD